jgi:molybdate transport system permease protein
MVIDFMPLILSFKLAVICTVVLIITCIPLAYWISSSTTFVKMIIRSLAMLPLVIPPSVLGFYFLILWSPFSPVGHFLETVLHTRLVFSFTGLAIALAVAGVPFMLNPLVAGFESLPKSLREASLTLGKSEWETLLCVLLPSIRPSLLIGIVMTFIHSFGEFGMVLMLGGKIPGKTLTASIALYDHVESLEYTMAHIYAGVITVSALLSLILLFLINSGIVFRKNRY